jgi:aspartate-semialdehyde dehydrogenase
MKSFNTAIIGATGLVGEKMREVLEERNFPVKSLRLFSSERSAGTTLTFHGEEIPVEKFGRNIQLNALEGIEIFLFSAGSKVSKEWSTIIVGIGMKPAPVIIDNSSAFRMDPEVPLVVPEVNPEVLNKYSRTGVSPVSGIIANPNCSTIQLVVALHPLHKEARIKRIVVSTYQSVSGYGRDAVEALDKESRVMFAEGGRSELPLPTATATDSPFPHPIAFNLIPQIDDFDDKGDTFEEMKMVNETRKIFNEPDLEITATCVRVPVYTGHSEAVIQKPSMLNSRNIFLLKKQKKFYPVLLGLQLLMSRKIRNTRFLLIVKGKTMSLWVE